MAASSNRTEPLARGTSKPTSFPLAMASFGIPAPIMAHQQPEIMAGDVDQVALVLPNQPARNVPVSVSKRTPDRQAPLIIMPAAALACGATPRRKSPTKRPCP